MIILKCLLGLIIGAFVGFILRVGSGITIYLVTAFGVGNINKGDQLTAIIAPFFEPTGAIIGFIYPLWVASLEASRDKAARTEEERRQREAREAQQQRERNQAAAELEQRKNQLASLLATTQRDFLSLPELVSSAAAHLDRAEHEFADGAFAPFWDEVEHAANKLAAYHEGVRRTSQQASNYELHASKLSVRVPKFSLPEGELPDARPVAQRLSQVVRAAQKNFQFATIYEQRKTNQMLYAGFGTLGAAISSLGSAISSSLQELSDSVHSSLGDLLQGTRDQTDRMKSISEQEAESLKDYQQKLLAKEDEQSKMLDNIQRRRKPSP